MLYSMEPQFLTADEGYGPARDDMVIHVETVVQPFISTGVYRLINSRTIYKDFNIEPEQ